MSPSKETEEMERISIRLPRSLLEQIDLIMSFGVIPNRSHLMQAAILEYVNKKMVELGNAKQGEEFLRGLINDTHTKK